MIDTGLTYAWRVYFKKKVSVSVPLPQENFYTIDDIYAREVFAAPFAVFLNNDKKLYLEPVLVYYFEGDLWAEAHTFSDQVKVNIYDDLWIDFHEIN